MENYNSPQWTGKMDYFEESERVENAVGIAGEITLAVLIQNERGLPATSPVWTSNLRTARSLREYGQLNSDNLAGFNTLLNILFE